MLAVQYLFFFTTGDLHLLRVGHNDVVTAVG